MGGTFFALAFLGFTSLTTGASGRLGGAASGVQWIVGGSALCWPFLGFILLTTGA